MVHAHYAGIAFVLHVTAGAFPGSTMETCRLLVAEVGRGVTGNTFGRLDALVGRVAGGALASDGRVGRGDRSRLDQSLPSRDCIVCPVDQQGHARGNQQGDRNKREVEAVGDLQSQRNP